MSQTHKDGRRGGAHRNVWNREYWSRRNPNRPSNPDWGRYGKTCTHRHQRRLNKRLVQDEMRAVA